MGKNDGLSMVDHSADDANPGAETSAMICAPLFPAPTTATLFPLKSSAHRYWLLWIWVPLKVSDPGRRGHTGEACVPAAAQRTKRKRKGRRSRSGGSNRLGWLVAAAVDLGPRVVHLHDSVFVIVILSRRRWWRFESQ